MARHLVVPDGIVGTLWGSVRDTCSELGIAFDVWQDGCGRLILAVDKDDLYAADTVVMSIPRQVGKTFLVGAIVFALCLLIPGLTVIWTAHRFKTARETFSAMKAFARMPRIVPHVERVVNANGEQSIEFRNGSRVLFGARENGFGLGFANVGMLVLDEGQRLTTKAMDDLVPTMNAAQNPLVIIMGTPPRPTDAGEVFAMLRQEAIDGESEGTLYIEFSADDDASLDDRAQLAKANPSYPHRTSERAVRRMRKNLTDESFRREAYGIHDKLNVHTPICSEQRWKSLVDFTIDSDARPDAFGVDMSHDKLISVSAAWVDGERVHVEEVWAGTETTLCVDWLVNLAGRKVPIVIDSISPANSMIVDLRARGCKVKESSNVDMSKACGAVENRIKASTLTHSGQQRMHDAIMGARRRPIRDAGGWGWDRREPTCQIYPLVAATLALFGATLNTKVRTRNRRREAISA